MTGKTSNRSGKGNNKSQASKHNKALSRAKAAPHMDSGTNLTADDELALDLTTRSETECQDAADVVRPATDAAAFAEMETKVTHLSEQLDATARQLAERNESYQQHLASMQSLQREFQRRIEESEKAVELATASREEATSHVQRLSEDRERAMEHLSGAEERIDQLNAALVRERNERIRAETELEDSKERWQDTIQEIESQLHQATLDRIEALYRAECLEDEVRDAKASIAALEFQIASMTALPPMDASERSFLLGHAFEKPTQSVSSSCLAGLQLDASQLRAVTEPPVSLTESLRQRDTSTRALPPPPLRLTPSTTSLMNASGSLPTPTSPGLAPVHATLAHSNGYATFTSTTDSINQLNSGSSPVPTQGTVAALQVQLREQSQVIGELQTLVRDLEREVCKARLGSAAQADLHLEYLKNVLVKYYTPGEEQYRELFFNVVAHILKLNEDERELVRNGMEGEHAGVSGTGNTKGRGWFGIF